MSEKWKIGDGVDVYVFIDQKKDDGHFVFVCESKTADLAAQIVREHNEFPRWVKCDDEMPPHGQYITGWLKPCRFTCYYDGDLRMWTDEYGEEVFPPTHWATLIEPPKD